MIINTLVIIVSFIVSLFFICYDIMIIVHIKKIFLPLVNISVVIYISIITFIILVACFVNRINLFLRWAVMIPHTDMLWGFLVSIRKQSRFTWQTNTMFPLFLWIVSSVVGISFHWYLCSYQHVIIKINQYPLFSFDGVKDTALTILRFCEFVAP